MRSWMIAFSLGIFICGFIPWIPPVHLHTLALVMPLLSIRFCRLRLAGAFLLGIFWCLHWAQSGLDKILPSNLEGQDLWLSGQIISLPQIAERSQRFEFLVTESQQIILLNLYQEMDLKPGEFWNFKVRLKRPHGFSNPGGFDYEGWLTQKKISATGYIRSDPENRLLKENTTVFDFQKMRGEFRTALDAIAQDKQLKNTGLIKALSIGDRFNITDQEWTLFTNTGTNHLIVISGLHVGLVALLAYRLGLLVFSFSAVLLLRIPAKRLAGFIAILAAFFYAGLAGFSLPAQRAFIMLAIFMLGQCLYRHTAVLNTYCLALGIVLALDPLAPQSSGFWLSFGAVGILILFSLKQKTENTIKKKRKLSLWQKSLILIKTQGFLFIGLLPLMLGFFQQVSLLAPLVNILAIPFISLLVVPLCLAALVLIWSFPACAGILLLCADFLLSVFKQSLEFVLAFPLSQKSLIQLPALDGLSLLPLICGIVVLLFFPGTGIPMKILKVFALSGFIPLFMSRQSSLNKNEFTVDILDAGQGLALLINTANHHLIYDAGPSYSPRFNAGSGVLLPFIQSQNIPNIDKIVISHGDNDHSGGLPALLVVYPYAEYFSSDLALFTANTSLNSDSNTDAKLCQAGQQWNWDGVHFKMLHPNDNNYLGNNSSCVLKISSGDFSVLLSGDIEGRAERTLLRNTQKEGQVSLKANILLAPHHGSQTSSSQRFIEAVSPDYVIFASGYRNRFKHPHPDVVARYRTHGTKMLNTANTGALHFHISAQAGIRIPISFRNQRKRYWSKQNDYLQ